MNIRKLPRVCCLSHQLQLHPVHSGHPFYLLSLVRCAWQHWRMCYLWLQYYYVCRRRVHRVPYLCNSLFHLSPTLTPTLPQYPKLPIQISLLSKNTNLNKETLVSPALSRTCSPATNRELWIWALIVSDSARFYKLVLIIRLRWASFCRTVKLWWHSCGSVYVPASEGGCHLLQKHSNVAEQCHSMWLNSVTQCWWIWNRVYIATQTNAATPQRCRKKETRTQVLHISVSHSSFHWEHMISNNSIVS